MILVGAVVLSEFLFREAPFSSCHASTVVETRKGSLLAAWFGGSHEGATDVAIYLTRHTEDEWSKPVPVARGASGESCYNPVLFQPRRGPLMLFFKAGTEPEKWHGMLTTSTDDGHNWSTPAQLPDGILGPIKDKPLELDNGEILCGSSDESDGWTIHFEWTRDFGKTWGKSDPVNSPVDFDAIQPTVLKGRNHRIIALGRTQQSRVCYTTSDDGGKSWAPLSLLDVKNPNSGLDAVNLADGRFLMVYNDSEMDRSPLNVAISNNAIDWKPVLTLESDPGEYSYPSVIQTKDGLVHICYTWNRIRIRHVVLNPKSLE
jgi:predicted neuraminidase